MNLKKNRVIGLALMLAAVVIIIIICNIDRSPEEETSGNVIISLPEADVESISDSKSETYLQKKGSFNGIEDYWEDCQEEHQEQQQDTSVDVVPSSGGITRQEVTQEDLFGKHDERPAARVSQPSGNPYRETPAEREARHQRRQEEAIELAERMQGKEKTEPETDESDDNTPPSEESEPEEEVAVIRRSGVISSFDDWSENSSGISSLDSENNTITEDNERPFKCMFARESKIKSGQRTAIILLEDLVVSGILVPKNTHLMASCKISSRLEMEISSIEIGGRIYSLGFEAYDIDGSKGIYCPDVGNSGKTVRDRGTNIIGSGLTGRMGRVAGDIVSTGVSLFQNANGEMTVTVPSGYTFFIIKKKRQ